MRILLDHNVPESLRRLITGHEVHTARYLGWDTLRNGELLRRTAASDYDIFLTSNQGIQYQHNLPAIGLRVITLTTNHRPSIERELEAVKAAIANCRPGEALTVSIPDLRRRCER